MWCPFSRSGEGLQEIFANLTEQLSHDNTRWLAVCHSLGDGGQPSLCSMGKLGFLRRLDCHALPLKLERKGSIASNFGENADSDFI